MPEERLPRLRPGPKASRTTRSDSFCTSAHTPRDNALVASLPTGPPHDATASGPRSAGIAPARPPGRSSRTRSATLGPRSPDHGPVPQRRATDRGRKTLYLFRGWRAVTKTPPSRHSGTGRSGGGCGRLSLKHEGWSQRTIAEALGVSRPAVSQWLAAAERGGPNALCSHPAPGRNCRLTAEQKRLIPEFLGTGRRLTASGVGSGPAPASPKSSRRSSASATIGTMWADCSKNCSGRLRCRFAGPSSATNRLSNGGVPRSGPSCESGRVVSAGCWFSRTNRGFTSCRGWLGRTLPRGRHRSSTRGKRCDHLSVMGGMTPEGKVFTLCVQDSLNGFPARDRVPDPLAARGGGAVAADLGWFAHPPSDRGQGFRIEHTRQGLAGSDAGLCPGSEPVGRRRLAPP